MRRAHLDAARDRGDLRGQAGVLRPDVLLRLPRLFPRRRAGRVRVGGHHGEGRHMITVELVGDKELIASLGARGEKVKREVVKAITGDTLKLEAKIKAKLSGDVLNVVSGNLRASIHSVLPVEQGGGLVRGTVGQSGDVKYGRIHEYGGKTSAHVIEAKGNALAFMWKGNQVFFKRVNHPGSVMPQRSFMRSSLREMQP